MGVSVFVMNPSDSVHVLSKTLIWTVLSQCSHSIVPLECRWFEAVSLVFSWSVLIGPELLHLSFYQEEITTGHFSED